MQLVFLDGKQVLSCSQWNVEEGWVDVDLPSINEGISCKSGGLLNQPEQVPTFQWKTERMYGKVTEVEVPDA